MDVTSAEYRNKEQLGGRLENIERREGLNEVFVLRISIADDLPREAIAE